MDDEDADLRANLAALGPGALADLQRVVGGSGDYRHAVLLALMARPSHADLATLIAMADTDEVVRLRQALTASRRWQSGSSRSWRSPTGWPSSTTC